MKLKLGMGILVLVNLVVWLGPWLATMDPETIHWDHMAVPPDERFWMGTDVMGRDLFIRTLQGGQVSMLVGLLASTVAVLIGVFYGMCSGYLGGRTDALMMRLVDVLYALPFLFLVILLIKTKILLF